MPNGIHEPHIFGRLAAMTPMSAPSSTTLNACDEILGLSLRRGLGDVPALLSGNRSVSYRELTRRTDHFAAALRDQGIPIGERVLIMLNDSPDFVSTWLGTVKAGAVAVAVNVRAAAKDLAFMVTDSGCRLIVIEEDFLPVWRQAAPSCPAPLPLVIVRGQAGTDGIALQDFIAGAADHFESVAARPDDPAFWLYTSGTTGTPKAAVHCHQDVLIGERHLCESFSVRPGDRLFSSSKLFFAFALGHCLIGALRAGATVILYEGWPDASAIAEIVERYTPDVMFSVPTFYRNLLHSGQAAQPAFKAVRHYVSAGEGLPESLYQHWLSVTGVPIVEGIGCTETVFLAVAGTPARHKPGTTGRPLPWAEVRLLDAADQPVTEPDTAGVLWVRMPSLCRGYWRQPEKTAAAFRDGWYCTGDVFTVDADGWWYHQGRNDDLLKISGQWVSPSEIEGCALAVPGIIEAVAVGVPNAQGLVRLALFLVARAGGSQELEAAVKDKLLSTLSVYKCPRAIHFLDEFPRTATGKIQRFRLRQMAMEVVLAVK